MKKPVVLIPLLLLIAAVFFFAASQSMWFSRTAPALPAVVDKPMEDILASLETELMRYDPAIVTALQPPVIEMELQQAEHALGKPLHPEIQALYRWHNGLSQNSARDFFPGHTFLSLAEAIRLNKELNAAAKAQGFSAVMAHEQYWLSLFPDAAGDGYYYDPTHRYETDGVFYNFRESGYYVYFPSIKNLLMTIAECYQSGVYRPGKEPAFELMHQITLRYGVGGVR